MQGTPCPASGFCGVPACGTWSSGKTDRGTPCGTGEFRFASGPPAAVEAEPEAAPEAPPAEVPAARQSFLAILRARFGLA